MNHTLYANFGFLLVFFIWGPCWAIWRWLLMLHVSSETVSSLRVGDMPYTFILSSIIMLSRVLGKFKKPLNSYWVFLKTTWYFYGLIIFEKHCLAGWVSYGVASELEISISTLGSGWGMLLEAMSMEARGRKQIGPKRRWAAMRPG